MTEPQRGRKPAVFTPDHPDLELAAEVPPRSPPRPARAPPTGDGAADGETVPARRAGETIRGGFRWGTLLVAAAGALASLAFALWFARFVSVAVARQDWIGWTAFGLIGLIALALVMIIGREIVGFLRLRRLANLKREIEAAVAKPDRAVEQRLVDRVMAPLSGRPALEWPLARLAEHAQGVRDPGDLFRIADRDVMSVLDGEARRAVAASARRIGVVSALSPTAALTVGWVLVENLRLLRALAGIYGGRPGMAGTARLARMVVVHIVATGGIALTDDLIGQFLGQDLLRRLSRRLGESMFNAALTARIGAAAITVIRPLPFLETEPIRARDFLAEITRRGSETEATGPATGRKV